MASYVSQEQIDEALAWEPIEAIRFFDCFLNELGDRAISKQQKSKRKLTLTMRLADAELTIEASFKNGVLLYEIRGFFPGMITFASYEQWMCLGT